MKILMLLSNGFDPDVRVYNEARSLSKEHSVKILAWDRSTELKKNQKYGKVSVERIHIRGVYRSVLNYLLFPVFWIVLFFKVLSEDFDVVHCHDFDTLVPGFLAGKLRSKKIVYDAHEVYHIMKNSAIIRPLELFFAKKSDVLITAHENSLAFFKTKKKIVINNAKSLTSVSNSLVSKHKKRFSTFKKPIILYIGGLNPVRRVFEIANLITDYDFVIFGRGGDATKLAKMSKQNIHYLGWADPNSVLAYSKLADIIITTQFSNQEAFAMPNKFYDAICVGKPILDVSASKTTALAKLINKYNCGEVVALDTQAINRAITKLCNKKSVYVKGASRAFNYYNWEAQEAKLKRCYDLL